MDAKQTEAALEVLAAFADAIQTLGTVPSGHLYAQVGGSMTLAQYEACINLLIRARMITVQDHLIIWIGVQ